MKIITFAVPCYNSAAYMENCIESLLPGGDDIEILLINDGSSDETPAICDMYAAKYPNIVKAIHQENGGHGEGVNQGIRNAQGLYLKIVDSDDWLNVEAMQKMLAQLRKFAKDNNPVDLVICNYVYEYGAEGTCRAMRYTNVFPQNQVFTWKDTHRFRVSQYLLMHSAIYRTQLLRDCNLELPKHTFYVDNIFVYQPLPYVKTMYYMNLDLYRYFIGRPDQSVNESIMVKRVDQQLRVTKIMITSHDLAAIYKQEPKLAKYMFNYLSMMMTISSVLLLIEPTLENKAKGKELWAFFRKHSNPKVYNKARYRSLAALTRFPGRPGRSLTLRVYRLANKLYHFN